MSETPETDANIGFFDLETAMKTFTTFKLKGTQYLVIPNCTGVVILDEDGNTYGAWQCEAHFIKAKGGTRTTKYGTSLPEPTAVGRAFPQIAHGENQVALTASFISA
jgi:hypothetical protein